MMLMYVSQHRLISDIKSKLPAKFELVEKSPNCKIDGFEISKVIAK